jgi:hypothetical protein
VGNFNQLNLIVYEILPNIHLNPKIYGYQICAYFSSSLKGCRAISILFLFFIKLSFKNISGTRAAPWWQIGAADLS